MDSTFYDIILVLHILAAALWFGSNLVMGLGSGKAVKASAEVNVWWAEVQGFLALVVKHAAFVVLLLTGVILVLKSDDVFAFSSGFVSLGFLTLIVGGALGGMVFLPGCRRIAASFRAGDAAGAKATIDRLGMIGAAESVLVVVTIYFMVAAR